MKIQCECGRFRSELTVFPKNTPGRMVCYCDDCQTYLHSLGRADLLDPHGGTEVIPVYPSEMKIIEGRNLLRCTRLSPKGLYRWSTTCCNTPVANIKPGVPYVGTLYRLYTVKDASYLSQVLGEVKCRIQGRFARGSVPERASAKVSLQDMLILGPFLLKGVLLGKKKNAPFFESNGSTPIVNPRILSLEERNRILQEIGFKP